MKFLAKIAIDVRKNCGKKKVLWTSIVGRVFFNPAVRMLFFYRLAQSLRNSKFGFWPSEIVWAICTTLSACHLSVRSNIRPGSIFPHPVGIVIGDGVTIESSAVIYQNVTIGLQSRIETGSGSYPRVSRGAIVYAGACLVGGIVIGKRAVIGANTVINRSMSEGEKISLRTLFRNHGAN